VKKFRIKKIIETDNVGFDALKCFLPKGSILWCKTINNKVLIGLKNDVDIEFILKQLNSVYLILNPTEEDS
jgi:hypothetical protein